MNNKISHLQFIQEIIKRMASNSFALKGWAVTLVAGIFALAGKDTEKMYFLIAYVPILVFWGLDAYYLMEERMYRSLYDEVRKSSDVDSLQFDLKVTKEKQGNKEKNNYWRSLTSKTEFGFYFPLGLLCTIVIFLTHFMKI